MPDFLKKANKQVRKVLGADEESLAAIFLRPRTGDLTKALGAPGGVLSKVGRFADVVASDETDTADASTPDATSAGPSELFGQNTVLVLTSERLLVLGHGSLSGRVRGVIGSIPLAAVRDIDIDAPEDGPATMIISFADDTSVTVTPGSRRKRFLDAYAGAAAALA